MRCSSLPSPRFDIYVESGRRALRQLANYEAVVEKVKSIVERFWRDAKIYAFGSAVEGKYTAASDIDILVVVDGVSRDEVFEVKAAVYREVDAPVELHVASSEEFERWYRRFVGMLKEF